MTDTPSTPAKVKSPWDIRDPESTACLLMLAVVLFNGDDARRLPFWPEAWGLAPPLTSVLVLLFLVLAVHRIGRYASETAAHSRTGQ